MTEEERCKRARARKTAERLGSADPRCVGCGEADPRCLELHHVAGEKFGTDTVHACRNCHRKMSDNQRDHPAPIGGKSSLLEQIAHFLLGLADLLQLAVVKLREFAGDLIERARTEAGAPPTV